MPKNSQEQTQARKDEIVNTCAALYEKMCFKEITIKKIGEEVSFSRASIYNYFESKEEIFLALLTREHKEWLKDLKEILNSNASYDADGFAKALAQSLAPRFYMLKLMSMNLYDMESNSRLENLIELKKVYVECRTTVVKCLKKYFPQFNDLAINNFIYGFFPFLMGIYPYTSLTPKQKEAYETVNIDFKVPSIYELAYPLIKALL